MFWLVLPNLGEIIEATLSELIDIVLKDKFALSLPDQPHELVRKPTKAWQRDNIDTKVWSILK